MGNLQELIDRATIEFQRSVDWEEAIEVLRYLSSNLGDSVISGTHNKHFKFENNSAMARGGLSESQYTRGIEGQISTGGRVFSSVTFSFLRYNVLFSAMKFDILVPGYNSVEEFETLPSGKGQLELIDKIKTYTEEYFSQNPGQ